MSQSQRKNKLFFFKNRSSDEFVDIINKELPIKLIYNSDLIDRVHMRYPLLSKAQIALIVQSSFEGIRYFLLKGYVLNFHKVFIDTKIFICKYLRKGKYAPGIKIKVGTPEYLKAINE